MISIAADLEAEIMAMPRNLQRRPAKPALGNGRIQRAVRRALDDLNLLRRRPTPTALNLCDDPNSIRRIGHRTVACLTLAKWETVSGRFGAYLRCRGKTGCGGSSGGVVNAADAAGSKGVAYPTSNFN
jgi:hypothetical protein